VAHGKNSSRSKITRHHIVPRSRLSGGDKDRNNIVELDQDFHRLWHQLFVNMTVDEVHKFIDRVMKPGHKWTRTQLKWLREEVTDESADYSLGGTDE